MESWVGSPEANLLNSPVWGIPDSSYVSGGTAYLKYISERTHTTPGRAPKLTTTCNAWNTCETTSSGGSSPKTYRWVCETTFVIKNGHVASYSFKGSDCTHLENDQIKWMIFRLVDVFCWYRLCPRWPADPHKIGQFLPNIFRRSLIENGDVFVIFNCLINLCLLDSMVNNTSRLHKRDRSTFDYSYQFAVPDPKRSLSMDHRKKSF